MSSIHFERHHRTNPRTAKWAAGAATDGLGAVPSLAVVGARADKRHDSFLSAWLRQVAYWQGTEKVIS